MTERSTLGITTTIPVEIACAAGRRVVDLNNAFIACPDPAGMVRRAEQAGFPQNACAWVKGLYAVISDGGVSEVVGVVAGDCSDAVSLLDILESEGKQVFPFAYPYRPEPGAITAEMERLASRLGTSLAAAEGAKPRLDAVRRIGAEIDRLAGESGCVPSRALFQCLLALSDFMGDAQRCAQWLSGQRRDIEQGIAAGLFGEARLRLGIVGVPTILADLWEVIESRGGRAVFQEIPRQFAMLGGIGMDLAHAYSAYTYPYSIFRRIADIKEAVSARGIHGIIHYIQSFCHRQIHDRLLREQLGVPILTLEADRPGPVDARMRTRIDAFLEQLRG